MTIIDKIETVAFVIVVLFVVLGLIVWGGLYFDPQSNRKRHNKRKWDSDGGGSSGYGIGESTTPTTHLDEN